MPPRLPAETFDADPFGHIVRPHSNSRAGRIWDTTVDTCCAPFKLLRLAKYNRWVALGFCMLGCLPVNYTTALEATIGVAVATWLIEGMQSPRSSDTGPSSLTFTLCLALATALAAYALAGAGQGITTFFLTTIVINAASNEVEARTADLYD